MLLPNTYVLTLALMAVSILCWGAWAHTLKKSQWRFELFCIDFSLGALVAALIAAFTVGSMGTDLSVQDSFLLVSKRPILMAVAAGAIFNLGNMLIVAAIEVSGMSVAVPIGFSLALLVTGIWNYVAQQNGNLWLLIGGCILSILAMVLGVVAHSQMEAIRRKAAKEAAAAVAAQLAAEEAAAGTGPAKKKKQMEAEGPGSFLAVFLAIAGGLVLGTFHPVMAMSMEGELGFTNPFAVTLLLSIGMLVTTFVYNLYFMNLPVKGLPISFFAYFTGKIGQHAMGLLGGLLWMAGACANFAAGAAQGEAKIGPVLVYMAGYGAAIVSVFFGMVVWKEFSAAKGGTKNLIWIMALFLLAGVSLVTMALRA
jgi:glucose uptake protein